MKRYKRYMVSFFGEGMERLGSFARYAYYDYEIGIINIANVINSLRRSGIISDVEAMKMEMCKCIMIEEDT